MDWDEFTIEALSGGGCSSPTTLQVNWDYWVATIPTGTYTHEYKATVKLYRRTGTSGVWTLGATQVLTPNKYPKDSAIFVVSSTYYYMAEILAESRVINGPCGASSWYGATWGYHQTVDDVYVIYDSTTPTADFEINGEVPADGCTSSAVDVYTCGSIILNNYSTSGISEYKVTYSKYTTNCTGSLLSSDETDWKPGNPSSIDLNTEFPGQFTNPANAGWYKIKLTVKNSCGTNSKQMCMKLNTITTASSNFEFIDESGFAIPPATTCATSTSLCQTTPQLDPGLSTGTINNYWLKIEEYTSACVFNKLISDGSDNPTSICALSDLSTINLASYVYNNWDMAGTPTTLYFYNNPDMRYKATLTVNNQCGQSSKTGWFRNNITSCKTGVAESIQNIEVFPNPVGDKAYILFDIVVPTRVSVSIIDMHGKEILSNIDEDFYDKPQSYYREIDLTALPQGLYVCKVYADKLYNVILIKQ